MAHQKTINILQKLLITKTALFILIFSFKRQLCHITSLNYNHTYSFRFIYWTTTFKYKKELKIETTCVTASVFPSQLQDSFYIQCSKYRMYRKQLYTQKCINIIINLAEIQEKILVKIWYITVFKTTWRFSKRVNFLRALVMILML